MAGWILIGSAAGVTASGFENVRTIDVSSGEISPPRGLTDVTFSGP